ncbi:hypothetical protein MTO96_038974 [Rhipicephalus appendiculatus]
MRQRFTTTATGPGDGWSHHRQLRCSQEDDVSDLPESTPSWAADHSRYICVVLAIFLSALTDFTISTYLAPSWGWLIFEWAMLFVSIAAVLYVLSERLIAYEPPPCML